MPLPRSILDAPSTTKDKPLARSGQSGSPVAAPRDGVRTGSERKEQAIYDAVHEVIMQLRIKLAREVPHNLDTLIAQAGDAAGTAAIAAYRKPLPRKK